MSLETFILDNALVSLLIRFFFNLLVLFILIRTIYYKFTRKAEYLFSFILMGIIIFLLCSLLGTVNIQLGMALGLFAVFAILRFRTVTYTTKDMTYTFTVIGVSVINSQANVPPPLVGALIVNSVIIIAAIILEFFLRKNALVKVLIVYNKPELLNPGFRGELMKELSDYTGEFIESVKIRKIDIGKGNAELEVYFREKNVI
jgi:hypothetical protein